MSTRVRRRDPPGRDLWWLDILALLVGVGAVALEYVADLQMHRFVRARAPGQAMDRGLWGWSRPRQHVGRVGASPPLVE